MPPARAARHTVIFLLLLVVAAGLVAGAVWRGRQAPAAAGAAPMAGASGAGGRPVPVSVAPVARKDVPVYLDGLGTVQAYNSVSVHSRIDGELMELGFQEGEDVRAGQMLARLDPRPYQAALEQAQATREKDQAQLEAARRDLDRYLSLGNRVTGQSVDTQRATVKQLEAQIKVDQAAIDSARTQLGYTTITAPFDGRTGIRNIDRGNIVHAADGTGLVTLTQMQPIAVLFTLPQQSLRVITAELARRKQLEVVALDTDTKTVLDRGRLLTIDNQIDQTTGTIRLKAALPNAARQLWPGGFVNMRLLLTTRQGALTVPAQVVQRGPQGPYAFVLRADGTVEMRPLTLGPVEAGDAVIDSGLAEGETVVSDGMAKLQAGSRVAVAGK